MVACGPGVERLSEEVATLFPKARIASMTSDTVHSTSAAQELIRQISEQKIDLVIGTQMIAKGHNFPMLTLVGVVDADLGLSGGDLRAVERFHLFDSKEDKTIKRGRHRIPFDGRGTEASSSQH